MLGGQGSQAYFVLDVLVVSVFGGGGGGRGGGGVRVDSVRDGVLLVQRGAGHFGCAQRGVPTVQTVQKAVLASTSL